MVPVEQNTEEGCNTIHACDAGDDCDAVICDAVLPPMNVGGYDDA